MWWVIAGVIVVAAVVWYACVKKGCKPKGQ